MLLRRAGEPPDPQSFTVTQAIARAAEGAGLPPSPGQEAPPLLPTTPCFPGVPNAACSVMPALTSWASGGSGSGDVEGWGVGWGVQQGVGLMAV